jgi:hypothetical protein
MSISAKALRFDDDNMWATSPTAARSEFPWPGSPVYSVRHPSSASVTRLAAADCIGKYWTRIYLSLVCSPAGAIRRTRIRLRLDHVISFVTRWCRFTLQWGLRHFPCSGLLSFRFACKWGIPGVQVDGVFFRDVRWLVSACGSGTLSRLRHVTARPGSEGPATYGNASCVARLMTLKLRVGRWRCRNERCARKTFVEKLSAATPFARRTSRIAELVQTPPC